MSGYMWLLICFTQFCSCSLLLWDCDDRTYSYYIEVSNDRQSWDVVSDHRNDECRYGNEQCGNKGPVIILCGGGGGGTEEKRVG